uniref:Winged helix-turn helix domain-containing protein n=1 Tax=Graphocephala atropunctata TaxID=36148 RepID=A0A1B6MFG2_9HEMI
MKKEAEANAPIHLKKVQERVVQATGVSESTLRRILKEEKTCSQSGTYLSTPNKIRHQKKLKSDLDDFYLGMVTRSVNDFHRQHEEGPTLKSLLHVLREKIDFNGSKWTLSKILRKLGFRWKKAKNNRKILTECF